MTLVIHQGILKRSGKPLFHGWCFVCHN
jgi:hypothetical protein